jgi:glycosyltransferase involved in cell wall biosynthesis
LRRELSHVDLFLAPSLSVIEQHRRRGFNYPMRHLPNFLPLDRASREDAQDAGAPSGRPYFLFVGRLVKLKGVQTLVDTFRTYDKADLLIAGDGNYEGELRRSAADLPHVRFLGRVHPDALKSLYARATAVLVPSLAYETFGVIALEAFAQRTPVVARELGAPAELVHESGGGFTYRSPEELLEAMEAVRLDPELRNALGGRGHAAFVERWSEGPHVARYLQLVADARAAKSATGSEPEPALR